jgi:hypothetical protein
MSDQEGGEITFLFTQTLSLIFFGKGMIFMNQNEQKCEILC